MLVICLTLIFLGVLVMIYSVFEYYKILIYMKSQNYEAKLFNNWSYRALLIMMLFFVVGYIFVGLLFLINNYEKYYPLIALILFFGSIFVLLMVKSQGVMTKAISKKTIELMKSMVSAMETKDIYTKGHSEHVKNLVGLIYQHLPDEVQDKINLAKLEDAALLHDIGKIGIPDSILHKPSKLTSDEMEVIKEHPQNAKNILENTCYRDISDWILYHHERIDGNGYYQIPGQNLPIESRIIALADTFSALYTNRVYRQKYNYEQAMDIIQEVAGSQLDRDLVDIFVQIGHHEIDGASVETALANSYMAS